MRALAIKVKNYADHAQILQNTSASMLLKAMLITIGCLALLDVFFLGSMVINIIERKSLEAEARTLGGQVATLELDYLNASNKVDLNLSHSLGFKETQGVFTTRKSVGSIQNINKGKNEI